MKKVNLKKTTSVLFDNDSLYHRFINLACNEILLKPLLLLLFLGLFGFSQGQQFTVYNAWNFESETLGQYTDAEITEDFNYFPNRLYSHNLADIVMDTINNTATKVMRITHIEDSLSNGFEMFVDLQDDYDEIYLSYNWKFSEEFNSTAGGKLSGFVSSPIIPALTCPESGDGFWAINMFKYAGSIISYHYDRTTSTCPWSSENYNFDTIYFNNGCWYNITQRLVMNTFTSGVANADGIKELWVDGRLIYQETNLKLMENESDTMKIDGFALSNFYGGSTENYEPITECYGYIDNIKVYMPGNDSISGHELHHPSTILPTPDEITDRTVFYDFLITSPGTLSNTEYGSNYSSCIDEAFLIDAGEGNTVNYKINTGAIGGEDYLFFYDGNTTDAKLTKMILGYQASFPDTIKSTGRYMFIRFSSSEDGGTTGWTGTISFNGTPPLPNAPTNLHITDSTNTTITIAWTDVTNETQYIIERSTGGGFTQIATVNADVTSYTNTGLTANTAYSYRVKATNSGGDSGYSSELLAHTANDPVNIALNKPAAATSIEGIDFIADKAFDGDATNTRWASAETDNESICVDLEGSYQLSQVILKWETAYGLAYSIDVSSDSSNWTPLFQTTNGDGGTDDINVTGSGRYVRMNGTDRGTQWGFSIFEFEVYGTEITSPPNPPSTLHTIDSTSTTITIGWTDNADNEDKFIIERSLSGSGFTVIDSIGADTTNYTDTGLTINTTYYYRVKAKNSYGASAYSDTLEAHTANIIVTNVALNKTATQVSTSYGGVASRAVDGNTDGDWNNGSVSHTGGATNAWWEVDLGLDCQIDSIEVWNRTDCCMSRMDDYYVLVSDTFTTTNLTTTLGQGGVWSEHRTSFPNPTHKFTPNTTGHYVRVQLGDYDELNIAEVIVWGYDASLKRAALSEKRNPGEQTENLITVYPNPGSNMITIAGFDQALEIKIVDMLGKVAFHSDAVANSTQVNVSSLKKGLYLIMIKTENNYHLKKFIKN